MVLMCRAPYIQPPVWVQHNGAHNGAHDLSEPPCTVCLLSEQATFEVSTSACHKISHHKTKCKTQKHRVNRLIICFRNQKCSLKPFRASNCCTIKKLLEISNICNEIKHFQESSDCVVCVYVHPLARRY